MNQAKLYSKYNDLQKTDNLFVLDNFLELLKWKKEDDNILDVGSGDGRFAIEFFLPRLSKNFGKYVGCDISENMVKFSQENYKNSQVDFIVYDIASVDIPKDLKVGFDHIVSFYTLHWVVKQRKAFKNMFEMLKPGGDMLLTFLASNPIYDVYQNMSKHKKWKAYTKKEYIAPYHDNEEPEKQLKKLLLEVGFECQVCKVENRSYTFPNLDIWKKSVKAINPILAKLPSEEVSNYMKDFVDEVRKLKCVAIENINNNEETIRINYKLFVVIATKPEGKD